MDFELEKKVRTTVYFAKTANTPIEVDPDVLDVMLNEIARLRRYGWLEEGYCPFPGCTGFVQYCKDSFICKADSYHKWRFDGVPYAETT